MSAMTPVRRSSRRIRKVPPEAEQVIDPSTQLKQLRRNAKPPIAEEKQMRTTRSNIHSKALKRLKNVDTTEVSATENQKPPSKRSKCSEAKAGNSGIQIPQTKSSFRECKKVAKQVAVPVSTKVARPALRDVDQVPDRFRKQQTVVQKTPSFTETFRGRLEWKRKHYDKPITSTPVPEKSAAAPTNTAELQQAVTKDLKDCFGFISDDEPEEILQYSTLISPIPKESNKQKKKENVILFQRIPDPVDQQEEHKADFSELLHKYHPELEGEELHFNPGSVKVTYANKHKAVKFPVLTRRTSKRGSIHSLKTIKKKCKPDKPLKTRPRNKQAQALDDEAEKWLLQKNKEFEEIEKLPLLIEKSPHPSTSEQECNV